MYKRITPDDPEYKLNEKYGAVALVTRKHISKAALVSVLTSMCLVYASLKLIELWKFGGESDRTKLRRTLALIHCPDASGGTSYELRKVQPGALRAMVESDTESEAALYEYTVKPPSSTSPKAKENLGDDGRTRRRTSVPENERAE